MLHTKFQWRENPDGSQSLGTKPESINQFQINAKRIQDLKNEDNKMKEKWVLNIGKGTTTGYIDAN